MKNEMFSLQKMPNSLYYQKNKRKISKKKKSSDYKESKSTNNIYKNYINNNVYIPTYKRIRSPQSKSINSSFSSKINRIYIKNDWDEKINLNFENLSSLFNINTDNIINLPDLNNEIILDLNIYNPFTLENNLENNDDENNSLEEKLSPINEYGLRYINNDIYNKNKDKNEKIILIQSFIRCFLLRKKMKLNLLNKIYLENRNTKIIIFIQKYIRAFLVKLRIRKKIIMNYIERSRKEAINILINNMRSYNNIIKTKKILFIKNKLEERNKYAKYIQETFRNYLFYNSFKKLMKELNEKYSIIYSCKGNKVELIIYLEENNNLIPKKYNFNFNKLINSFTLFINPDKLYPGKYKCQFIIDDIVICDKNYPYIQYKNELYNIIEIKLYNKKKEEKRKRRTFKKNNSFKNIYNNVNIKGSMKVINHNRITGNNYQNNIYQKKEYNNKLEDIKDAEDRKKTFYTKDNINEIKYMKENNREYINDDLDFTDEDIINIKKLRGSSRFVTNYQKLKEELLDKIPVNKIEKLRKISFKSFNFNY